MALGSSDSARAALMVGVAALVGLDLGDRLRSWLGQPDGDTGLMLWPTFPYDVLLLLVAVEAVSAARGRARMLFGVAVVLGAWAASAVQQLERRPDMSPGREWLSVGLAVALALSAAALHRRSGGRNRQAVVEASGPFDDLEASVEPDQGVIARQ